MTPHFLLKNSTFLKEANILASVGRGVNAAASNGGCVMCSKEAACLPNRKMFLLAWVHKLLKAVTAVVDVFCDEQSRAFLAEHNLCRGGREAVQVGVTGEVFS